MRTRYLGLIGACLAAGASTLVYRGPGWRVVRGSVGDALAVMFLAFVLGAAAAGRTRLRTRLAVCGLVAVTLELAQLLPRPFRESGMLALVLGAHFDPMDFAWYAVGLACAALVCCRVERGAPITR